MQIDMLIRAGAAVCALVAVGCTTIPVEQTSRGKEQTQIETNDASLVSVPSVPETFPEDSLIGNDLVAYVDTRYEKLIMHIFLEKTRSDTRFSLLEKYNGAEIRSDSYETASTAATGAYALFTASPIGRVLAGSWAIGTNIGTQLSKGKFRKQYGDITQKVDTEFERVIAQVHRNTGPVALVEISKCQKPIDASMRNKCSEVLQIIEDIDANKITYSEFLSLYVVGFPHKDLDD